MNEDYRLQDQQQMYGQEDYPEDPYQGTVEDLDPEDEQFLGFSEQKPKEGLYQLFNKVLTLPRTTKVGNVDKRELGDIGISIRESLRVALIGQTFGHPMFAQFFALQSNIITDSSMAKKGWFTELFVTSKRFAEKAVGQPSMSPGMRSSPVPEAKSKWSKLFGGGGPQGAMPRQ